MSKPPRTAHTGTFFITAITRDRHRLFQVPRHAELLIQTLQHYRAERNYLLHAFVIMPDHLHLLLTPTETLERTMQLIKGGFSRRLNAKLPVWQRGYTDHRIRDRTEHLSRKDYILQNPVRARLAPFPELYPYSSAYRPPPPPPPPPG